MRLTSHTVSTTRVRLAVDVEHVGLRHGVGPPGHRAIRGEGRRDGLPVLGGDAQLVQAHVRTRIGVIKSNECKAMLMDRLRLRDLLALQRRVDVLPHLHGLSSGSPRGA